MKLVVMNWSEQLCGGTNGVVSAWGTAAVEVILCDDVLSLDSCAHLAVVFWGKRFGKDNEHSWPALLVVRIETRGWIRMRRRITDALCVTR